MRHHTRATALRRASAAALALVFAALLGAVAPAAAADPVTIAARGLLGGRFSPGEWAAVSVSLTNDGAPVTGTLRADSASGEVRRVVELPAGSRKEVVLYVRPDDFAREIPVTFTSDAGTLTAVAGVSALDSSLTTIAMVGDEHGALRAQLAERDLTTVLTPFDVPAADIPERPEPLAQLSVLVWAGDSSALTDAQRRTLERWVGGGGQLIIIGGPDWQARSAAFSGLLPVTGLAAVDDVDTSPLRQLAGEMPEGAATLTVATGALAPGSRSLVAMPGDDERPLMAVAPRGAGRVVWIGADLAASTFGGWEAGSGIWSRLLASDAARFTGRGSLGDEASAMTQALANLPALEVPPAELLLAVIVGYILLIGPVSYLVLRRLDRRELAWITAPLLVVVFSACSYGIGTSLKGSQIIVNQISVVRSVSDGAAANVTTWAGIFSPARATYDLSVTGDALLAEVSAGSDSGRVAIPTEQGDPAHLRDLSVNVFGMRAIRADTVVARAPSLSIAWRVADGRLRGTVTNAGEGPRADVAVLTGSSGEMVGALAAGESREFEMAISDFTGATPADQVYGFERGDVASGEARVRSVRRQVLVGLVGFGHGAPVTPFSTGGDRGPFVVGWSDGGPTEVLVDGQTVQHYHQSVEVVSGQPELVPSDILVQPIDITTRVTATDGRVERPDSRSATIIDGSATFRLLVPLELRGMTADRMTVLLGTDAQTVLVDQNIGGLVPPGYLVELLDVDDGTWTQLGDPTLSSRFVVRDPASALDADGAITIRVSTTAPSPDVGFYSIYASASVEGSLP
jgi:hypothetical protein